MKAREEAGVGIGLADDLRAVRTALVKAHLAKDYEAAFDLMLFQLARAVFTNTTGPTPSTSPSRRPPIGPRRA